MKKVVLSLVLLFMFMCGSASAYPSMAVLSTYSSSSWLPEDINIKACTVVDNYLADKYCAIG